MLKSVSWAMYLQVVMVAITVYYLTVLVLYFRNDVLLFVTGKLRRSFPPETQFRPADFNRTESDPADPYSSTLSSAGEVDKYNDTSQGEHVATARFQQEGSEETAQISQ